MFTAHIDAFEDSPGACDNGGGTVVLLLLAELPDFMTGFAHTERDTPEIVDCEKIVVVAKALSAFVTALV